MKIKKEVFYLQEEDLNQVEIRCLLDKVLII